MSMKTNGGATRRQFLGRAGMASAGAIFGSAFAVARAEDADAPYAGFRMGAQSYCFRHFSLDDAIKKYHELGLKHVELFPGHADHSKLSPAEVAELRKKMDGEGLSVDAYGVVGFNKDEAASRRIFEFAKTMGLRSISSSPDPNSFDMLDKLVAEYKIPIAIHNHGPHDKWGRPEVLLKAIKDHNPLIGLCADTGHFLRAGVDPVEAIKMLKGRFYGCHVKDFVDEETEKTAGEGKLNILALMTEARAQKFEGAFSIEYELDEENPVPGIQRGLANIRKAAAQLKA